MNDVHIRTAAADEAQTILAFWKTEGTSITDDVEGLTRLIDRDPEALILAESGGALVGSVIAGYDGWRCSLYRLAVLPSHRHLGISTALLEAAEERFLAVGRGRLPPRGPLAPLGEAVCLAGRHRVEPLCRSFTMGEPFTPVRKV